MDEPNKAISDEQAAAYLKAYTAFLQTIYQMKRLGYSSGELKREIDVAFHR